MKLVFFLKGCCDFPGAWGVFQEGAETSQGGKGRVKLQLDRDEKTCYQQHVSKSWDNLWGDWFLKKNTSPIMRHPSHKAYYSHTFRKILDWECGIPGIFPWTWDASCPRIPVREVKGNFGKCPDPILVTVASQANLPQRLCCTQMLIWIQAFVKPIMFKM